MTKDEQPQKLSEESCADFVDRIQLEALNQRWASVVISRRGLGTEDTGQAMEVRPAPVVRPDHETRSSQAD